MCSARKSTHPGDRRRPGSPTDTRALIVVEIVRLGSTVACTVVDDDLTRLIGDAGSEGSFGKVLIIGEGLSCRRALAEVIFVLLSDLGQPVSVFVRYLGTLTVHGRRLSLQLVLVVP